MRIIKFTEYIKEVEEKDKDKNIISGGNGTVYVTLNQKGMGKVIAPVISESPGAVWQSRTGAIGSGDSYSPTLSFSEYVKEQDGGGGVAFATANAGGMGNVVAPTVGSTPGSVWGSGSGAIGSGDAPSYDYGNKFGLTIDNKKDKKGKKKKKNNKIKNIYPHYFTKEYMAL